MNIADFNTLVVCKTFNQSKFITDALNGFAMQKTDFPFVCLVMDDASTDGEQEVIKDFLNRECLMDKAEHYDHELADIVIVGHKTNHNCTFAVYFLKQNLYYTNKKDLLIDEWETHCKYEALCEGDDYWIDPFKLQKQKEYLDNHQECGMCYTNFNIQIQETGQIIPDVARNCPRHFPMHYNSVEEFILAKGYVCPPSWFIRCELLNAIDWLNNSCDGTFEMFCYFMANTVVHYDDYISSVYRILPESACQSRDINKNINRIRSLYSMQIELLGKYHCSNEAFNKCTQLYYKEHLSFFMDNGFWDEVQSARLYFTDRSAKQKIALILSDSRLGRSIYKIIRTIAHFSSSIFTFAKQYPF